MNETCACCSGIRKLTPSARRNRPGLSALYVRAGTHAMFLQTMKARLSSLELSPADFEGLPSDAIRQLRPLLSLTTRASSDPAIALLDAWALVADVLTFYQERIANEGFLHTATERRSILELARLIGYRARPGVSASVYLAYTLEKAARVVIPAGSRSQTIPGPGELPQSFETSASLAARDQWNLLRPRATHPQLIAFDNATELPQVYVKGTTTRLKAGDPLLLVFTSDRRQVLRRVRSIEPQAAEDRTRVTLVPVLHTTARALQDIHEVVTRSRDLQHFGVSPRSNLAKGVLSRLDDLQELSEDEVKTEFPRILEELRASHRTAVDSGFPKLAPWVGEMVADLERVERAVAPRSGNDDLPLTQSTRDFFLEALELSPSVPPANPFRLTRSITDTFRSTSDAPTRLLGILRPAVQSSLYHALGSIVVPPPAVEVYAFRVSAPPFGYNATPTRPRVINDSRPPGDEEWHVVDPVYGFLPPSVTSNQSGIISEIAREERNVINLDAAYDSILPGSWIVVETATVPSLTDAATLIGRVGAVRSGIGRGVYGVSGKTTRIELKNAEGDTNLNWLGALKLPVDSTGTRHLIPNDFDAIRSTAVYAQSEQLALAEKPFDPVAEPIGGNRIELASLNGELEAGRWIIVSGERVDIPNVTGVHAAELAMLAGVELGGNAKFPHDASHSTLILATALAYTYKRDTVTIHGNVIHATHGETHDEAIGSGDAGAALQVMPLRQSPLTYLAAPTPEGATSTLALRVDDVLWHERETLLGAGANDHLYITRTDDDDTTTVLFGDGKSGARLPTGHENVTAHYRTGIGRPGNANAEQISLLATRPLGVKSVINPLPATGGADREDRDQVRRNAPLAVAALDRLVSVRDYEDFARTFAGIAKASAALISDGRRQVVHVTIAGSDDIPIADTSDLFINLRQALRLFGDPAQPLRLATRKRNALFISAKVRLSPDYKWEAVEPKIRAALLDTFSFARRELGQDAVSSEVFSAIQAQPGVVYADLDIFDSVKETATRAELAALSLVLKHRIRSPKAAPVKSTGRALIIKPAELAYLTPSLPDTLTLTELPR